MTTHDGRDPLVDQAIAKARQRSAGAEEGVLKFENDHLAGRATWGSLTVRLTREDHRAVSELRRVLGFDDLPPADDDPILFLAHLLGGIATLLALLVKYLVTWSRALRERNGPDWGAALPTPAGR
jgi:hypothetical protein